jgi:hypothetical protein
MVPIGQEPAPGDHESSLKIFLVNLFLQDVPVPSLEICISNQHPGLFHFRYKLENLMFQWIYSLIESTLIY